MSGTEQNAPEREAVDVLSPSISRLTRSSKVVVSEALASPFSSRRIPHSVPVIDIDDDDDVFSREKQESEEDKKLVDWVMNVFVPACKNLLEQCSEEPVITSKVQTYLRLLSNTITFFCNERQSPVVSPSRSVTGK